MRKLSSWTRSLLVIATVGVLSASALTTSSAQERRERHPHIHHAILELRESKRELKEAAHDFGGHRVEAMRAIDQAIDQLEQALKYDRR